MEQSRLLKLTKYGKQMLELHWYLLYVRLQAFTVIENDKSLFVDQPHEIEFQDRHFINLFCFHHQGFHALKILSL
jgi:hypothetical protein